jgi:hypothetical protein
VSFAPSLVAAALLVASLSSQAAPNLITNGSFEDTVVPVNTWVILPGVPGWTGVPDIELRNDFDGPAQDGVNYVELDTFANSSMSQTFAATGLVRLSFWYGPRANANALAGSNDLSFSLGNLSGTLLEGVPGGTPIQWIHYSGIADVGSSGSATLTFSALGLSDMIGGSIDNVSVTAVPEPETAALLLAGLLVVGTAARRRGRAANL